MLLSYLSLFVAWYVALVKSWDLAFQVLYEDVIAIACGIYVITEAIYILRNNAKGLGVSFYVVLFNCHGEIHQPPTVRV